jgi:hypothetical protein
VRGRRRYSAAEGREIRRLLVQLRRSDRAEQKALRARLRRHPLRFYITDWDSSRVGFTAADFDDLVLSDAIEIDDF